MTSRHGMGWGGLYTDLTYDNMQKVATSQRALIKQ